MPFRGRKIATLIIALFVTSVDATPLFDDATVIDITLTGAFESLLKDTRERNEHPFVLQANGNEHDVTVRVRGNSRVRICSFPPLRLTFGDDTENTEFAGQKRLRLVTHCRRGADAESNALAEYAAYRIFNLISDIGYRVRLLRITYADTEGRRKYENLTRYAFAIESRNELAERTGGVRARIAGVSLASLDDDQAAAVYVFQYLIGNTDWSLVKGEADSHCCHNGDIFEIDSRLFYVPYDFDLAGLVDADYAYPDPSLRIRKVTQRYYRGYCTSRDTLTSALARIVALEGEILDVLMGTAGFPDAEIASKSEFLSFFFARAENQDELIATFERLCIKS